MISEVHAGSDIQRCCFSSIKILRLSSVLWVKRDLEALRRVTSSNLQHAKECRPKL